MPRDNPQRKELQPLMDMVMAAHRLRAFNRALNLHEHDLLAWPVDFVETVIAWGTTLEQSESDLLRALLGRR